MKRMDYDFEKIRTVIRESFILFSVFALCMLAYMHFNQYSFPGLSIRIYWMLFIFLLVLLPLYFLEIVEFLASHFQTFAISGTRIHVPLVNRLVESTKNSRETYRKYTSAELAKIGINTIFQIVLTAFLLMLLVQEFYLPAKEWLNMNYFLITVIFFGAASVLINKDEGENTVCEPVELTEKDYIFIAIAGIAGTVIVWYKIKDIGWVSYLIGVMSGVLIVTLSILMIQESGEDDAIDDCGSL